MAKTENEAQVTLGVSDIAALLREAIKTALQEAKNPSLTEDEIAKRAKEKAFWVEQAKAAKEVQLNREKMCGHLRPEDGKSLFHWMPVVYPMNAEFGVCCRCFKEVKNYDEGKLVDNPEYNYWRRIPTGVFQG